MECYYCDSNMIWEGEHDVETDESCATGISSHWSCSKCPTSVVIVHKITNMECMAYWKGFDAGRKSQIKKGE